MEIDLIAFFLWVGLGTEFIWVQLWPGSKYVKSFAQFLNLLNLWNLRLKATELAQGALSRRILSWQFLQILRMGWNQTMEDYGNNVSVLWPSLFPWHFPVFLWGSWESLVSILADLENENWNFAVVLFFPVCVFIPLSSCTKSCTLSSFGFTWMGWSSFIQRMTAWPSQWRFKFM